MSKICKCKSVVNYELVHSFMVKCGNTWKSAHFDMRTQYKFSSWTYQLCFKDCSIPLLDWENISVKIILWLDRLRKFNTWINTFTQRCSTCAQVHTSWGKWQIDNYSWQSQPYSQRYLALLIPGSRPNARTAPGAPPYCNRQPLKIFMYQKKFNTTKIIFNRDLQ